MLVSNMVTIRLKRMGKRSRPSYRIVVQDSRRKVGGACLESLGHFNPYGKADALKVNLERARYWMARGAATSDTVRDLLRRVAGRSGDLK